MSVVTANRKTAISVRKDPNVTTKPGIRIQPSVVVNIPPQLRYSPSFNPNGTLVTPNIYTLLRKITNEWFPPDNFTTRAMPAGNLVVNGQAVGQMDIAVIPGQSLVDPAANDLLFSSRKDVASAWIIVKGNLDISDITLTPSQRKLFTVVYVTGNLTFNDGKANISMSSRGANHSGTGDSGGITAPANIQITANTMISATGAAGAIPNSNPFSAELGQNGGAIQNMLQSGGGGGGWNDYDGGSFATVGQGGSGTCFSGGAGSGGSANPGDGTTTGFGEENGGAGGADVVDSGLFPDQSAAGAGNPNGELNENRDSDGTGGTLIVIVEGNITLFDPPGTPFSADGNPGRQVNGPGNQGSIFPFGGGSGGGIVVLASQNAPTLGKIASAAGGASDRTFGQSGGNGDTLQVDFTSF
jgi:hypothetical protein